MAKLSKEEKLKFYRNLSIIIFCICILFSVVSLFFLQIFPKSILIIYLILDIVSLALMLYNIKAYNDEYKYFPQKFIIINITKKPSMNSNDLIDYYIINNGTQDVEEHIKVYKQWFNEKLQTLVKDNTKSDFINRGEQWEKNLFNFVGIRTRTRYKQINYQRYPYKVDDVVLDFCKGISFMEDRIQFMKDNNFNISYNNYHKKDQRSLLTKKLKDYIKERDNFTCQICGKYMPDEVGLQIDHIIPIAKGGKTVPENLRVLCSKCNGRKGQKLENKQN